LTVATPPGSTADPAAPARTFVPGEAIADRYRIVRFLAEGGMGEVYEAEDLALGGAVALKTVRPEIAADTHTRERFKREIHIARRVTHPNVCRIYDLGTHAHPSPAGGAAREILFLTMELLVGETLRERIERRGRLATADSLRIAEQIAAGLDAAHGLGIVHRDFKTANVVLAPSPDPRRHERAVITDFGLARAQRHDDATVSLSQSGELVGTPAYMAPEQVQGREPTPAADIYALGVVLYEMVTGVRPFDGGSSFSVAVRRLTEPAPDPRLHVLDLDPRWAATILRCLERDPAARFPSAEAVAQALRGGAVEASVATSGSAAVAPAPAPLPPAAPGTRQASGAEAATLPAVRSHRRRYGLPAALAILLIGGLAVGYRAWESRREGPAAALAPAGHRRSIAVLGFKNLGRPSTSWISTALTEMLRTELAAGDALRTVPGETVARLKLERSLADADSLAADTLASIREILGSDLVVLGSYLALGGEEDGRIRLDFRVQDTRDGELLVEDRVTGTEEELFDLVARAGGTLRQRLGVAALAPALAENIRAALPTDPEAARLYAEGLAKLRVYDAITARDLLEKAAAISPEHPLVHSALAAAWSALGFDARALAEARLAAVNAAGLPEEERLAIEARRRELEGAPREAAKIYAGIFAAHPDDVEHGLRLAAAQVAAGEPQAALATVSALRRLPVPVGRDPRIDLAEAAAAKAATDFTRQRTAAQRAAARAREQGAHLLVAQGRLAECDAGIGLGELVAARRACAEASTLFVNTGEGNGAAEAANMLAVSYAMDGELERAGKGFAEALAAFRTVGNRNGVGKQLINLASIAAESGDRKLARERYGEALEIARETGNRRAEAPALANLAALDWDEKDLPASVRTFEQALAIYREIGARHFEAVTLTNLGEVLHAQGQLAAAEQRFAASLAISRELGEQTEIAYTDVMLARLLRDRGDLARARSLLDEAKRLFAAGKDSEGEAMAARELAALTKADRS
jgi:tetratricopeptide (TPR) repeat protein